mgnify:CR=1 FL=1
MKTHRLRLAPINTGFYTNGEPTLENINFFSERSGRGIDLCMVGNIATTAETVPNASTGILSDNNSWASLAEKIREGGSIPAIQLSATLPGYKGQRTFVAHNTAAVITQFKELFNQMSEHDWQALGGKFVQAIKACWKHGFSHIQLHAAHGYAFSLVLDPEVNPDKRGWKALISILDLLASSHQHAASLRVSWHTGLPYDDIRQSRILELWKPFSGKIELDLSNGYYNLDKRHIYPPHQNGEAPFLGNAVTLATEFPEASFVVAGNIWNPYETLKVIPSNLNISIGRALIADPDYLLSEKNNKTSLMLCDDCGKCHFYSNGAKNVTCPVWTIK